jgi:16S rRNA (adenine1518-N6/adenine1519-N6)-dimethyltransferase
MSRPDGGAVEGHRARRQFGQNFLVDGRVIADILAIVGARAGERIVEIGPGLGALTEGLVGSGASVVAIEIDRDLLPRLERKFAGQSNFELVPRDALSVDLGALRGSGPKLRVVGNLPYNISSPLLFHFLDALEHLEDLTIMLQREVAERLAAPPGCGDYGRLSIACQACCEVHTVLAVPPFSFEPAPKVDSAVVRLSPRGTLPSPALRRQLGRVTQQAFSMRRKVLRHSLGRSFSEEDLASCGVTSRQRPEELSVAQYLALAEIALGRDDGLPAAG